VYTLLGILLLVVGIFATGAAYDYRRERRFWWEEADE
jgi:uncharacterized membrane protein HdeD (DUF308 family)